MVKTAQRLFICLFALFCLPLFAKELPNYHIGDTASADITTPVALDVTDSAATAALKSSEALKTPAIFRNLSDATNVLTREFLAAFASAHSNFLAAVANEFSTPKVSDATIASEDFGYLITAFNIKNRNFPVTSALAAEWAHGDSGEDIQEKLLGLFQQAARFQIRPDNLTAGFVVGETVRLVPAANANEKLSLDDVSRGKLVAMTNMFTVSRVQNLFRRAFPDEQQPFARAMAEFIQPNCVPDVPLTQLARADAVRQMVVAEHFDAGQIIVHRGDVIDEKIKVALDALDGKLKSGVFDQPIVAKRAPQEQLTQLAQAQPTPVSKPVRVVQNVVEPPKLHIQSLNPPSQTLKIQTLKFSEHKDWLLVALAGISVVMLFVVWRLISKRRRISRVEPAVVPEPKPSQNPASIQAGLAPQVAQVVREAVMQELALQRRELLLAHQAATDEIVALVQRLDKMQVPMQDRLRAYEAQIQELEKELAARTEENRELLKLKIEMVRRQLETERVRGDVEFNYNFKPGLLFLRLQGAFVASQRLVVTRHAVEQSAFLKIGDGQALSASMA